MNNFWIIRLLHAGIGKKIAKNCHKKHSGILIQLEDIVRGRGLYDESMRNSHAWFYILHGLGSVSLHGPVSPASFFLLSQFFHLLSPQFTGTSSRISKLSTEWCLAICIQSQVLHEPLSWSWGAKRLQISLLISHRLLLYPFLHSKLHHPELCATVG